MEPKEWFTDEPLIHSEWRRMPERPPMWLDAAYDDVVAFFRQEGWRRWSTTDWLYILTGVSIGVAILREFVVMYTELQKANA